MIYNLCKFFRLPDRELARYLFLATGFQSLLFFNLCYFSIFAIFQSLLFSNFCSKSLLNQSNLCSVNFSLCIFPSSIQIFAQGFKSFSFFQSLLRIFPFSQSWLKIFALFQSWLRIFAHHHHLFIAACSATATGGG